MRLISQRQKRKTFLLCLVLRIKKYFPINPTITFPLTPQHQNQSHAHFWSTLSRETGKFGLAGLVTWWGMAILEATKMSAMSNYIFTYIFIFLWDYAYSICRSCCWSKKFSGNCLDLSPEVSDLILSLAYWAFLWGCDIASWNSAFVKQVFNFPL